MFVHLDRWECERKCIKYLLRSLFWTFGGEALAMTTWASSAISTALGVLN